MPSSTWLHESRDPGRRWPLLILWTGVLGGPLLFLLVLQANYVLSYVSCETGRTWFLHAITFAAVLALAGIAVRCWTVAAAAGREVDREDRRGPVDHGGRGHESGRPPRSWIPWMGYAGVAMSVWFAIVLAALDFPVLVLAPCL